MKEVKYVLDKEEYHSRVTDFLFVKNYIEDAKATLNNTFEEVKNKEKILMYLEAIEVRINTALEALNDQD